MPSNRPTDRERIAALPVGSLFTYFSDRSSRKWSENERISIYYIAPECLGHSFWILDSHTQEEVRTMIEHGNNFTIDGPGDVYPIHQLANPWRFTVLRYGMTGELVDAF